MGFWFNGIHCVLNAKCAEFTFNLKNQQLAHHVDDIVTVYERKNFKDEDFTC